MDKKNAPMNNKIYNWGILAPGRIAGKFATELSTLPNARLLAVGSRDAVRAAAFAKEYGAERSYGSYEELVCDPEVDLIYIASPHSHHALQAQLALSHGKAVLCEKALALNQREVGQMIQTAHEHHTLLMEAFFVPHQPSYLEAKRVVESGRLGKIKHINSWFGFNKSPYDANHRLLNRELGGGALLDIGLYCVFDTLWFLGLPQTVGAQAKLADTGADESVTMQFDYPDGVTASLYCSFYSAIGFGTDIFCEKGIIRLRRNSAIEQSVEIEIAGQNSERLEWPEHECGLKLEAAEAMRCMENRQTESAVMPHQMSLNLIMTLDRIRKEAGIHYPGRD